MASRSPSLVWSKRSDAGTRKYILSIVTAEIQTVNVVYFQRKIQLSGFSAYPDSWLSQLIRIIGVIPYCQIVVRYD